LSPGIQVEGELPGSPRSESFGDPGDSGVLTHDRFECHSRDLDLYTATDPTARENTLNCEEPDTPERPPTADDRHQQQPANMKPNAGFAPASSCRCLRLS